MIIQFRYLTLAIVALLLLTVMSGCALVQKPYHRLRSYKGKVIDLETKQPLAGAVFFAVYSSRSASPAGVLSAQVDAQETVTDENGEFVLPEVKVMHSGYHGDLEGKLHVFKPGYGTLDHRRTRWTCDGPEERTKCWIPYDTYITFELQQLKTMEERKKNYPSHSSFIPPGKQRLLMQAINEERRNLGFKSMLTVPKVKE